MISKTKKRLFETTWYVPCIVLMLVGMINVFSYGMRTVAISWQFGMIRSVIPIMEAPLEGSLNKKAKTKDFQNLEKTTPMIILANDAFYIGDMNSFTQGFSEVRNKLRVPHHSGSPQVGELIKVLKKWHRTRKVQYHLNNPGFAVMVPGQQWPVAVIIQIIHYLVDKGIYKHIVLGSEFI